MCSSGEIENIASNMLGYNLVTKQTGSRGRRCDKVGVWPVPVISRSVSNVGIDSGKDADLVGVLFCSGHGQGIQSMFSTKTEMILRSSTIVFSTPYLTCRKI